jgi:hypothetical protein
VEDPLIAGWEDAPGLIYEVEDYCQTSPVPSTWY